ncbi:hypothetical protein F5Y16DRAFT_404656 [Xylariaceae sp. FL0255]|nr:hypothetical protein F5Y16DRAFT_404656 [Xylariaceae sp. FL0255]
MLSWRPESRNSEQCQPICWSTAQQTPNTAKTATEKQLSNTIKNCIEISREILKVLDDLKINSEQRRRLKALLQAFKNRLKHDAIVQLIKRLEESRADTSILLLAIIRQDQSAMSADIKNLVSTNKILEEDTKQQLDAVKIYFEAVKSVYEQQRNAGCLDINQIKSMVDEVRRAGIKDNDLHHFIEDAKAQKKQRELLRCLRFPEINSRNEAIKPAHEKTFQWILDLDKHNFTDWLRTDHEVYWIRWKAGSGKSTLMRYLTHHIKVDNALSSWAGDKTLIVLKRTPELISQLFPSRWASFDTALDPWTEKELFQALKSLGGANKFRFGFFIDELDEYSGEGKRHEEDFSELIDYIKTLSRLSNVKYVLDELKDSEHFQAIKTTDSRGSRFGATIVDKAQGVFLWVFLVVNSLLRGAAAADNFDDLERRLAQIPEDLEDFFQRMLEEIEPVYWEQAAQILRLVITSKRSPPLIACEYLSLDHALNPSLAKLKWYWAVQEFVPAGMAITAYSHTNDITMAIKAVEEDINSV